MDAAVIAAAVCAAGSLLAVGTGRSLARSRLARLGTRTSRDPMAWPRAPAAPGSRLARDPMAWPRAPGGRSRWHKAVDKAVLARLGAAALAGGAAALVVGGLAGLLAAGLVGPVVARMLSRLQPRAERLMQEQLAAVLPLAVDLLAACVTAGTPPGDALTVVARAVGGPFAVRVEPATSALTLGADPMVAWDALLADPVLAPLARAMAATGRAGTAPGPQLARLAADARDTARRQAQARARSLGARAAAPLGLCFLPAFVLVGIVPLVAGVASTAFQPGTAW